MNGQRCASNDANYLTTGLAKDIVLPTGNHPLIFIFSRTLLYGRAHEATKNHPHSALFRLFVLLMNPLFHLPRPADLNCSTALADGADRAVDMRISGRYNSDVSSS